jgi:hypothetical protein
MILSTVAWMLSGTFFNVMLSVIIFIVKSVLIVDTQHNNTQQSNLNVEWHIFYCYAESQYVDCHAMLRAVMMIVDSVFHCRHSV